MVEHRIDAVKGDTFNFSVKIDDAQGRSVESLTFKVKESKDAPGVLVSLSIGSGITLVEEGLYAVEMTPAQTAQLEPGEKYHVCRLELGDYRHTLIYGTFNVIKVE